MRELERILYMQNALLTHYNFRHDDKHFFDLRGKDVFFYSEGLAVA